MGSLQGGMSAVWINGKPLEDNQIDPFLWVIIIGYTLSYT
jgi:hypothetical protein